MTDEDEAIALYTHATQIHDAAAAREDIDGALGADVLRIHAIFRLIQIRSRRRDRQQTQTTEAHPSQPPKRPRRQPKRTQ